jgi:hypothetical protein
MRALLAAVVLLAMPALAAAQSVISSPLAPIGIPLPTPMPSGRDPWIMSPPRDPWITNAPRDPWIMSPTPHYIPTPPDHVRRDHRRGFGQQPVVVYVLPQYPVIYAVPQPAPTVVVAPTIVMPAPEPARARLEEPAAPPAPEVVPLAKPSTLYYIPGCYMGNVAPEKVKLPAGCDLSKLITQAPQ